MVDPRSVVQKSIMPSYSWLVKDKTDFLGLRKRVSVLRNLGVPYSDEEVAQADRLAEEQALAVAKAVHEQGGPEGLERREIVALIAYLQALGQKGKE